MGWVGGRANAGITIFPYRSLYVPLGSGVGTGVGMGVLGVIVTEALASPSIKGVNSVGIGVPEFNPVYNPAPMEIAKITITNTAPRLTVTFSLTT